MRQRLPGEDDCLGKALIGIAVGLRQCAQIQIISGEVRGRLAAGAFDLGLAQLWFDRAGDAALERRPVLPLTARCRSTGSSGGERPHIGLMPHLDLSDDEATAPIKALHDTVHNDRYPFLERVRTLKAILGKLRPQPVHEPIPPPKVYAPPQATAGRRRHAGRWRSA
jgi:hypothetical protein